MNTKARLPWAEEAAGRIVERLGRSGRLSVLTGAGVSAESGIATFRDAGGLWEQHSLEDVATPEGFARDPELVLSFYNARRRGLHKVEPNPAHRALAQLEAMLGDRFALITQNIDDLHERAGSERVLHMHGELFKARCVDCAAVSAWAADIVLGTSCSDCGAQLRPHIVWFGEMPFHLEREIPTAVGAEVFVSIGTSGTVYPAAGFVGEAKACGALTVELNLEPSENAHLFELQIEGRAGERLPQLVEAIASLLR